MREYNGVVFFYTKKRQDRSLGTKFIEMKMSTDFEYFKLDNQWYEDMKSVESDVTKPNKKCGIIFKSLLKRMKFTSSVNIAVFYGFENNAVVPGSTRMALTYFKNMFKNGYIIRCAYMNFRYIADRPDQPYNIISKKAKPYFDQFYDE